MTPGFVTQTYMECLICPPASVHSTLYRFKMTDLFLRLCDAMSVLVLFLWKLIPRISNYHQPSRHDHPVDQPYSKDKVNQTYKLLSTHPSKPFPRRFSGSESVCSGYANSLLIKATHQRMYPCPVCARNITSRGVSYLCNRCFGWVHSKCSDLQNVTGCRLIKDWVCSFCNSPSTLPKPQPLPPSIPTQAVDGNYFIIMQFNANSISNKLAEGGIM